MCARIYTESSCSVTDDLVQVLGVQNHARRTPRLLPRLDKTLQPLVYLLFLPTIARLARTLSSTELPENQAPPTREL